MAGLCSRNLREMNDSAMLQRKTNTIAAGIPLKTAKNQWFLAVFGRIALSTGSTPRRPFSHVLRSAASAPESLPEIARSLLCSGNVPILQNHDN